MGRYQTERDAGRMAVSLAAQHYFGPLIMAVSTPTGVASTRPLDAEKLKEIRGLVQNKFGRKMSEVYRVALWTRRRTAIAQ